MFTTIDCIVTRRKPEMVDVLHLAVYEKVQAKHSTSPVASYECRSMD